MVYSEGELKVERIISGGQTGADRAALDAALEHNFPCGGWCPKGRKAEDGALPPRYPLKETISSYYGERTEKNVKESDGTLVFVKGKPSGGTALTIKLARSNGKPCLILNPWDDVMNVVSIISAWVEKNGVRVLNVAGPRESECPGIYWMVRDILRCLIG